MLRGWQRRFWQLSPDHRGTPEAPGRVVTLIEDTNAHCGGVAFWPSAASFAQTMAELEVREQNGYDIVEVPLTLDSGETVLGITYIAGPDNPSFAPSPGLEVMARQIANSVGPSGDNSEYLFRLEAALQELDIRDHELELLAREVRVVLNSPAQASPSQHNGSDPAVSGSNA